ncbi:MAG: RND transporter [Ponticaulis sp.]|nr:RND transporter [Ponticaulis sp.]
MRAISMMVGLVALSGCASLHSQTEPATAPSPIRPEAWKNGEPGQVPPTGDWVSGFNDPAMSSLIDEALTNNPDLKATLARVEAARANAAATYGRSLPSIGAGGSASWNSTVVESGGSTFRNEAPSFRLNGSASWEPDLWGRISAGIAAAEADLAASEADFAAARLSLAARTAIAWIQLNDAVRQEALAEATLDARENTLTLTERRFRSGLVDALDVRLARSALASSEAALVSRRQQTGQAKRAIEILLGRYPSAEIDASERQMVLPAISGAGDPTSLLARRPDIAAAEARIVAAGFRVDQARLALRPSLSLTATLSSTDDDLSNLIDPAYLAGQLVSSLTAPIYNGGALKANIEAAEAQAQLTGASYVSAVLSAWKEVEDTLAADDFLLQQVDALVDAYEEAVAAEALAQRQYQNGLATIFNLIDAQTRRINAEASLISVQSTRAINRVQFHLALGGDLPLEQGQQTILSEGTD